MKPLGRFAPWFVLGDGRGRHEPLTYRVWKRAWQARARLGWRSDLFDRIEATDWDLLIVLDACRYDVLADVVEDAVVEPAVSPATATKEFLLRGAAAGVFDGVTYVSGSPQTEKPECDLGELCEDTELVSLAPHCWDGSLSTVSPTCVFEEAETRVRDGQRTVAHVKQPHYPHISGTREAMRPVPGGLHPALFDEQFAGEPGSQVVLSTGAVDLDRAASSYRACVRFAWDLASDVAQALSAEGHRVVVTADHGEAFGEWGFVEHPVDVPIRTLRTVPWVAFDPVLADDGDEIDPGTEERLRALGYAE